MNNLITQFKAARRVSAPLVAIKTPDPRATINAIQAAFTTEFAMVEWDAIRGLQSINEHGAQALALVSNPSDAINPVTALEEAQKLTRDAILFVHGASRLINSHDADLNIQAIWNLRDQFKSTGRTLVLLGPDFSFPAELSNDVLVMDEPLPDATQLAEIVAHAYADAELGEPEPPVVEKAIAALLGLSAFAADQVVAMSLTKAGLDLAALRERKRQTIEETPGLSVWRGNEKFADIGGLDNIKTFLGRVVNGNEPPRAIVFVDEIEKAFAGAGHDSSGVAQDQLGTMLSWMQDNRATGIICIGPPGTSKSMLAKATGNEANIPTVALDFGAMKGSLVGESEAKLRSALKVVNAMAGDRVFFIATCNSISSLPPEFRRRFTFGTFFFDLPTPEEKDKIWELFLAKYKLQKVQPINDEKWTGAEIKQCCEIAHRLACSIEEAAAYIVPVAVSAADQVESLRTGASGRFISASYSGLFQHNRTEQSTEAPKRKITLEN
jgi:hypothetical protein